MSNDSIPNCLNHKDSRNIQVRLDYMMLYRNEAKAKVIRTMETWTDQKRAEWFKLQAEQKEPGVEPPEEALWITMSYEEFSVYAYGTIKRDDIKMKVDELVTCQHMKRRPHPMPGYAPQYLLNLGLVQKALDEQDMPSLFEDIGKIKPPRKKHTPQEKYPQGEGINTPRVGGKIPLGTGDFSYPSKNTTKNLLESSKNEGITTSSEVALHTSNVRNFQEAVKRKTNPSLPALSVSDSQVDRGNDEEDEPTVKMPITKPQQTISTTLPEAQASSTELPQVSGKSGACAKSDTKEIQRRINEHRGYALEEKGQIVQERTAIKSWCNMHTIEEYEQVMRYLTTQDRYWKLEENKYRIGGVTLAKETPKALAAPKPRDKSGPSFGGYYMIGEAM